MIFRKKQSAETEFPPVIFPPTVFSYYEIGDLEQGTESWKEWRRGVIGASDAPVIMKENRWSSPQYLMDEKLGIRKGFSGNAATREGNQLEDSARKLLAAKYRVQISPIIIQDGKIPFLAASLDAIDKAHTQVFEIKCGEKAYSLVAKNGEIPSYYIGQLQHILMICQLNKIVYAAYRPYQPLVVIEVHRDEQYISKLRAAEKSFADELVTRGHKLQSQFRGSQITRNI